MRDHMAGAATMTPDAKVFHELWQSAERELAERPSRSAMVDLVAAIIQDEAKYNPVTNTWDVQKAAEDIVTAFETA
jgi:hypothetical protein